MDAPCASERRARGRAVVALPGSFQLKFGAFCVTARCISVEKRPMPRRHGAMARPVYVRSSLMIATPAIPTGARSSPVVVEFGPLLYVENVVGKTRLAPCIRDRALAKLYIAGYRFSAL